MAEAGDGDWRSVASRLDRLAGPTAQLDCLLTAHGARPASPEDKPRFGCFSYDPPDADGVVRIHFSSRDSEGEVGPLAAWKVSRRRSDLAAMCRHIIAHHSDAKMVAGRSWLYNIAAYRRLFPPAYVASRQAPGRVTLDGSSTWGQVLTHRQTVRADVRDQVLANLAGLDPAAPWLAFPLRALAVQAPLQVFVDHFAAEPEGP